jgi:hypothetical protein
MPNARILRSLSLAPLLALVPACSENNDLEPGTFTARLSGARTETLTGSAVAGTVYTEAGVSYTLSLLDQGPELVFLTVSCSGEGAPAVGTHPLGPAETGCSASYRRTVDDPFTTIEHADAVSGSLVVRAVPAGAIEGTLDFTGTLVVGETEAGDLSASATFDAEPIGGGGGTFDAGPAH